MNRAQSVSLVNTVRQHDLVTTAQPSRRHRPRPVPPIVSLAHATPPPPPPQHSTPRAAPPLQTLRGTPFPIVCARIVSLASAGITHSPPLPLFVHKPNLPGTCLGGHQLLEDTLLGEDGGGDPALLAARVVDVRPRRRARAPDDVAAAVDAVHDARAADRHRGARLARHTERVVQKELPNPNPTTTTRAPNRPNPPPHAPSQPTNNRAARQWHSGA